VVTQAVLLAIEEALFQRQITNGLSLIHEVLPSMDVDAPPDTGELLFTYQLAKWIDMDFSLLLPTQKLLNSKFSRDMRRNCSYEEILYLRFADGVVNLHLGQLTASINHLTHVLTSSTEDPRLRLSGNYFMGRCRRRNVEYDLAMEVVHEAKRLATSLNPKQIAVIELLEAWIRFQRLKEDDLDQACSLLHRVEAQLNNTDDYITKGNLYSFQARMAKREGKDIHAIKHFGKAIAAYRERDRSILHPSLGRALANRAFLRIIQVKELNYELDDGQDVAAISQTLRSDESRSPGQDLDLWIGRTKELVQKQLEDRSATGRRKIYERVRDFLNDPGAIHFWELANVALADTFDARSAKSGRKTLSTTVRMNKERQRTTLIADAGNDLTDAEKIYESLANEHGKGLCRLRRAALLMTQGEVVEALQLADEAYEIAHRENAKRRMGHALVLQSQIKTDMLRQQLVISEQEPMFSLAAQQHGEDAVALGLETKDPELLGKAYIAYGAALLSGQNFADALQQYWHAVDVVSNAGLNFLWNDLADFYVRLCPGNLVEKQFKEWLITREGKTLDELKDLICLLMLERHKDVRQVAKKLKIDKKTVQSHLSPEPAATTPARTKAASAAAGVSPAANASGSNKADNT